jgi:hypothetical protein
MSKPNKPAASEIVARVVSQNQKEDKLPAGIEAAWEAWSKDVQNVDAPQMALLKAAFAAGVESVRSLEKPVKLRGDSVG